MQPVVQAWQPMHRRRSMAMPQRRSPRVFRRARFRSSRMISRMSSRISTSSGFLSRDRFEKAETIAHQIEERNQRHRGDHDQGLEDRPGIPDHLRDIVGAKDRHPEAADHQVYPCLELGRQYPKAGEDQPDGTADRQEQEERHDDSEEDAEEEGVEESET